MQLVYVDGTVSARYHSTTKGKSREIEIAFSGFITVPSDWSQRDIANNIDEYIRPVLYEQLPSNILEAIEAISGGALLYGIENIIIVSETDEVVEDIDVEVVENAWW